MTHCIVPGCKAGCMPRGFMCVSHWEMVPDCTKRHLEYARRRWRKVRTSNAAFELGIVKRRAIRQAGGHYPGMVVT